MTDRDESLTGTAARGGMWLVGASTVSNIASLIAQIALGWVLSERDFGIYALAIGTASVVMFLQDGGTRLWLARTNPNEFEANMGSAFWLAMLCSIGVAGALSAGAPLIANAYDEPAVLPLLLVLSLVALVSPYLPIGRASLQMEHRFRSLSSIELWSAVTRHALVVVLAVLGFGAMSFVLPLVFSTIFESIAFFVATRLRPWRSQRSFAAVREVFRHTKWSLLGVMATAVYLQADYIALGLVTTAAAVGVYYFAYQLSVKPLSIFAGAIRGVVLPIFASTEHQPHRRAIACRRGAVFLGATATPLLLLLVLIAPDIEEILWRGRWIEAVPVVQILALALPIELMAQYAGMVSQSANRFKEWAGITFCRGAGLAVTAGLVGFLVEPSDVWAIALGVSGFIALSAVPTMWFLLEISGVRALPVVKAALVCFVVSLGCLGLAFAVLSVASMSDLHPLINLAVATTVYIVSLWMTWRALKTLRQDFVDVASQMPVVKRLATTRLLRGRRH
jgi:O-antigen/teichoic acid export membrane protein